MSRTTSESDLSNVTDQGEFMRSSSNVISQLANAVNGQLEFDKNFLSQTISVTFPNANTDLGIGHKLNKTGLRYMVASKSKSCDVFTGTTSSTKNTIYLQNTQAGATVTLVLF